MQDYALAVVLALAAAISWGLGSVLVKQGQRYMATAAGTLISLIAGCAFIGLLAIAFEREAVSSLSGTAIVLFALIGILNFPIGRFFNYMSIDHLGVGRSTPILAASPLFAMVFAVAFTGESVRLATFIGTALILFGLYVTLRRPPSDSKARHAAQGEDYPLVRP